MSRPLRWSSVQPEAGGPGRDAGGCQSPPCTLSCPVGTELGDEMSPRMGAQIRPERKTGRRTFTSDPLGDSVDGPWLV